MVIYTQLFIPTCRSSEPFHISGHVRAIMLYRIQSFISICNAVLILLPWMHTMSALCALHRSPLCDTIITYHANWGHLIIILILPSLPLCFPLFVQGVHLKQWRNHICMYEVWVNLTLRKPGLLTQQYSMWWRLIALLHALRHSYVRKTESVDI